MITFQMLSTGGIQSFVVWPYLFQGNSHFLKYHQDKMNSLVVYLLTCFSILVNSIKHFGNGFGSYKKMCQLDAIIRWNKTNLTCVLSLVTFLSINLFHCLSVCVLLGVNFVVKYKDEMLPSVNVLKIRKQANCVYLHHKSPVINLLKNKT